MRPDGRYSLRQVVVLVVLAVVLNAQFTWWVVYSLRENRASLKLERQVMVEELRRAARGLAMRLRLLEAAVAQGAVPTARSPFSSVVLIPKKLGERVWEVREGGVALLLPLHQGLVAEMFLPEEVISRWLQEELPGALLLTPGVPRKAGTELIPLGLPFSGYALAPDRQRWESATTRYQRRVVMVVTEGIFFWVGMAAVVALLWRTLRQESLLEQQRQNFISAVTHELKTPVAGIRLALETVLSGRAQGLLQEQFLRNALADAERLQNLVEKVLELTRFASGVHRLNLRLADLSELVEEELDAAQRRAEARSILVVRDITPGVRVPHDGEGIAIILSNLLENAFKYASAPEPRVEVKLWVERGQAILEVADNGIGISKEEIPKIFGAFYRGGDEVARRTPGTGIGLFVANEIAKAHGGKLLADSDGPGQGARFRLVLPGAAQLEGERAFEYDDDEVSHGS
ncbi:MAG: sensor histidine kinase [Thermoanaerobaculaceae bacterium]